ncbi:hypothetical protein B0H65DRAFT_550670 [Neurospora tetraspora]|uniref:Uncharacterized protein n=1 Tax=Neurospora tetraspora TaxID=94610 RepID=A0AAE0JAP9_9PEZI|nr:hypothetical protein B0H65DRAFT_550670 [Neurospora tetraspora]
MERDIRRDRGQWKGTHTFKDIICDGDSGRTTKRNGGLKMGQTYYFYYELDGATETHDPTLPSTNNCPYLPGQTVNTLEVPVEHTLRNRSASTNSLREENYMTMNPADRYNTPQPAVVSLMDAASRVATAPLSELKRSARSTSPGSSWFSPRRLFGRKQSSSSLPEIREPTPTDDTRSIRSSGSSKSRDMSPESLRRFLSDDVLPEEEYQAVERPAITIPDDIAEEIEDDDMFATSAVSEYMQFTGLSPPPSQRSLTPSPPVESDEAPTPTLAPTTVPCLDLSVPTLSLVDTGSPQSPANSPPAFYHSDDDEDETPEEDLLPLPMLDYNTARKASAGSVRSTLSTYSLPQSSPQEAKGSKSLLLPRIETNIPVSVSHTSFLNSPTPNSGLEDLMSELGLMADAIRG